MPLDEVRRYRPALEAPADLSAFWDEPWPRPGAHPLDVSFEAVDTGLRLVDVFDVSFSGFGGDRIRAWLRLPSKATAPLPVVVGYVGYGGGRGLPHQDLLWANAGYAHLVMDTRGQGAMWGPGDTPDPGAGGSSRVDGVMTDGILDAETYYYRRRHHRRGPGRRDGARPPGVDGARVAVAGGSQGGGLSVAVAGLVPDLAAVMPDVVFMSDFPRAVRIADQQPYTQIARYLHVHRERVAQVERTLSYFDAAILGRSATAPALFSVALMDTVCPPSTVYAAYNWYAGTKEIVEYGFNDHEGGAEAHEATQLKWLGRTLGLRG